MKILKELAAVFGTLFLGFAILLLFMLGISKDIHDGVARDRQTQLAKEQEYQKKYAAAKKQWQDDLIAQGAAVGLKITFE
jgi:hypothetical protein